MRNPAGQLLNEAVENQMQQIRFNSGGDAKRAACGFLSAKPYSSAGALWLRNCGTDFRPDSNIDVLVEFEPGHVPGLALIRMQDELSALLGGREVDLVTPKFLHPRIRARVLSEMAVQYAG